MCKEINNKFMSDRTEALLRVAGLCPKCGEKRDEPYFMAGDEECSYCSGEFYCACGNGTTEHELEVNGVCGECR
jgi:hypothetical protein